jgi:hypothetical protein
MAPVMGLVLVAFVQAAVAVTTVAQGGTSGIMEPREVVINSAVEWQALWKEHGSGTAPAIDFSQSMVVGVFLGTRPTAGYEVNIVAVRADAAAIVVVYRERQPGRDALLAQVLTSPFHLVSLPRQTGRVEFRRVDGPSPAR